MSAFEVTPNWKSPRKLEEEKNLYVRQRFESYMLLEQQGKITRAFALSALREELAYAEELDDCPTGPIDTNEIRNLLDE